MKILPLFIYLGLNVAFNTLYWSDDFHYSQSNFNRIWFYLWPTSSITVHLQYPQDKVLVMANFHHIQQILYILFILFGFYITFNTVQVISRRVVLWAEETSTYSWSRFCTVN